MLREPQNSKHLGHLLLVIKSEVLTLQKMLIIICGGKTQLIVMCSFLDKEDLP